MRILLICPYFLPYENPRAFRWTAIAQEWMKKGWEVDVVCSKHPAFPVEEQQGKLGIYRAGFNSAKEVVHYFRHRQEGSKTAGSHSPLPYRINQVFLKPFYWPDDAWIWQRAATRTALSLAQANSYAALVSVSLPFTAHLVAERVKQQQPNLSWLVDIGDPFSLQPEHPLNNPFFYQRKNRKTEQRILNAADRIVVTNQGAANLYLQHFSGLKHKISVIPPVALPPPSIEPIRDDIIRLGYFGSFFRKIREPDVLLKPLAEMYTARPDFGLKIEVHFYGEVFFPFQRQLAQYSFVQEHGNLSREEAVSKMQQMDYLLLPGNSTDFQLPSKVADYYVSGKPILHFAQHERDPIFDFFRDHPGFYSITNLQQLIDLMDREVQEVEVEGSRFLPGEVAEAYMTIIDS